MWKGRRLMKAEEVSLEEIIEKQMEQIELEHEIQSRLMAIIKRREAK